MDDYLAVTDLCQRLAGRMSDDPLAVIRGQYAAGEFQIGESTLVLGLLDEDLGITQEERDVLLALVDDANRSDLEDVASIDRLPPLRFRFHAESPRAACTPFSVDSLVISEAVRHEATRLFRAWRTPVDEEAGDSTWIYVLEVAAGTDQLDAFSGVDFSLSMNGTAWSTEVVEQGAALHPYRSAALAGGTEIWRACR
ncbi:hypothetical protein [Nocardia sp. NPDC004415]